MKVLTVHPDERNIVINVAQKVFAAYDGAGREWNLTSDSDIWAIHLANRAGVVGVELSGLRFCVKLFYDPSFKGYLKNFFHCSKAKRAWRSGVELMQRGIAVPRMVGYAEGPMGMGLMITALIENASRLDQYIELNGASAKLAKALGLFIRHMHDAGVTHSDLSVRNIMVRDGGDGFVLLDYEDACFSNNVSQQQRLKDIHHLNERALGLIPLKLRLIFLRSYLGKRETRDWVLLLDDMIKKYPSKYTQGLK